MTTSLPRTYLFVPGDRPERFGKAVAAGADRVILDLEDGVAADAVGAARTVVREWLERPGNRALVRISGAGDALADDLDAIAGAPGLIGVMVAKSEHPPVLAEVRRRLGDGAELVALVESAIGVAAARPLALVADRLAIGSLDLSVDLDIAEDSTTMAVARAEVVLASRLAGRPAPIDTVTTDVVDSSVVAREAERARADGFGAKLCIHPRQVAPVDAAFAPTAEQVAWAERVLGLGNAGGAVAVDGRMVDRPVLERARRVLDQRAEPRTEGGSL